MIKCCGPDTEPWFIEFVMFENFSRIEHFRHPHSATTIANDTHHHQDQHLFAKPQPTASLSLHSSNHSSLFLLHIPLSRGCFLCRPRSTHLMQGCYRFFPPFTKFQHFACTVQETRRRRSDGDYIPHSLAHSLTHSLTHSLAHSLTHSPHAPTPLCSSQINHLYPSNTLIKISRQM
jgi:hypothetical protein